MKHVTIYREPGRYAGWPANYGMWAWGDEIVLGFTAGYPSEEGGFHARDRSKPFETLQARSADGGHTWQIAPIPARTPGNRALSADEHMEPHLWVANALDGEDQPVPHPGGVDFTHPGFALMCARTHLGAGARSWFYTSVDRCRSWQGPYSLPMFDQPGIAARTDYVVYGPSELLLFLTAAKSDGREGRVFCARTTDGGRTFRFVSWIGPEPAGFHIMPAGLRLAEGRLLCAIRCSEKPPGQEKRDWIDLYESFDDGASWTLKNRPVASTGTGGSPPTLTRLQDGRLCMTYGYRDKPYGIRARLSADDGASWGEEIMLREDGGSHDLGYPRTVQLENGTIVTAYYFNDRLGDPAYMAATLWRV